MDQGRSYQLSSEQNIFNVPRKKRVIVGASDSADLRIAGLSDIHCLIEFQNDRCKIYSLSKESHVKINGEQIVAGEIKVGDKVEIGKSSFVFENMTKRELPKGLPQGLTKKKKAKKKAAPVVVDKGLPSAPEIEEEFDENYPLSSDPNTQFSEYIFEDADEIYPIFKYTVDKKAAEVIILHKGKILSVDYIPEKDGIFSLAGVEKSDNDIEFAYLGKDEKAPLLEIKGGEIYLNKVPGFKHQSFSDGKKNEGSILLGKDDIHLFEHEEIKIFVKGDEAPPLVKAAPILRRDNDFKKYLILCLLFVSGFLALVNFYQVDPDLEKEKAPERIATILYKPKKLRVTKKNNLVTKKVKKKKTQKAPIKKVVEVSNNTKKTDVAKGNIKAKGKNSGKKGIAKKGKPNKKKIVKKGTTKKVGKAGKTSNKVSRNKKVTTRTKNKGRVDTYKSADFSSSLSSLMAKGGTLNSFKNKGGVNETFEDSNARLSSEDSARVERAELEDKVGSLTSVSKGKLDSSFGTEGLVQKKQVYIAGVPYREVILGSIDRNDIMRILLENVPQFRYCYQSELDTRQEGIDGVLSLNFVIGPSGHVTQARVVKADKSLPRNVRSCITSHLKTIQFPRPKGGGQVSVNTPLNLHSKSL